MNAKKIRNAPTSPGVNESNPRFIRMNDPPHINAERNRRKSG